MLPQDAAGALRSREWVAAFAGGLAVHARRGTIVRGGVRDTQIISTMGPRRNADARRHGVNGQLPEFLLTIGYRW